METRTQKVGKGPYRSSEIELPPAPRVSWLVIVAFSLTAVGSELTLAGAVMQSDAGLMLQLVPGVVLVIAGVLTSIVALLRLRERDDLCGRRLNGVGLFIGIGTVVVASPVFLLALLFLMLFPNGFGG